MKQQPYLGVMEERERRGDGGSLTLHTGIGGIASSSIGQTTWESKSEGKVNIPFALFHSASFSFSCRSLQITWDGNKANGKKNMQGITSEQKK